MLTIAVVMDPLETVQLDHDTSYLLMAEADRRGHAVVHVAPRGVAYGPEGTVLHGRRVGITRDPTFPFEIGPTCAYTGADLDAVLIRTDPPFDADYLAVTQLLDLLRPSVFVMNRPSGLRDANEKLAALRFPDLGPPTIVSSDLAALDRVVDAHGAAVVKPLHGHGGAGVLLVRADDPNRRALLKVVTADGHTKAIAQPVVPGADLGDRRVVLLDGHPIGALLRRNTKGGFVHNLAAGGNAFRSTVDDADRLICHRLQPWLRERGLWLAGIDLIGGRLIEINVTSPTGLQEINRFDGVTLERPILDFVERLAASHLRD